MIKPGWGVPVDFERRAAWLQALPAAGFDISKPAIVVSTGVSMYLTKEANAATLAQVASFAAGSTLAMMFLLPLELAEPEVRPGLQMAEKGARASGTPFISFYMPNEIVAQSREAAFIEARPVFANDLAARYFADKADGLRAPQNAEELLVAIT